MTPSVKAVAAWKADTRARKTMWAGARIAGMIWDWMND